MKHPMALEAVEWKVIITVMFVIRFLIFITDRHSRSLVNVSAESPHRG